MSYRGLTGKVPTGPKTCDCCDHLTLIEVNGVYVCPACDFVNEWPSRGITA